jgi:probable phosphoglycerate mutase
MAVRVYLIRHGETEWSLNGRHTGRTDVPLTEHGEEESRKLGVRLPKETFSRVFSSPRLRARRTCELMGLAAVMEIDSELAEWDYGNYEGLRTAEIRKRRPQWNIFRDGCAGGESPTQISERVDRIIARLRKLEGDVAIFSHGHLGRVFGARWIGLRVDQAERLLLGTASVSVLEYDPTRAAEGAVALWNADAQHLCDSHVPLGDTRSMKQRSLERWESEGGEIPPENTSKGSQSSPL